jgi:integrase
MAHIEKRKTKAGEWRHEVRYRGPDGKERSRTFPTRTRAVNFKKTIDAELLQGTWVDPERARVTLRKYAHEWLDHRPKPLRPRTRDTYNTLLRLHIEPTLGDIELGKITPSVVRKWHANLAGRGPSQNTAAKAYRLVHAMLETAVADEVIHRNPCVIKGAGVERSDERPVATIEQVWAAADEMPKRYRCAVLLAGFVGLRRGEILGLECRHLNLLHGTLTVEQQLHELADGRLVLAEPKTDAGKRTLVLPPLLVGELERQISRYALPGPSGRVFPCEGGGALRPAALYKHWNRARLRAGLPRSFRFHDLRHTANTITAAAGASTRELMHRMGHASAEAALRYQHATRERDSFLAAALGDLVSEARPTEGPAPDAVAE